MLSLYWRTALKPYRWQMAALVLLSLIGSAAEVAGLGLIAPLIGLVTAPPAHLGRGLAAFLTPVVVRLGMPPRVEVIVLVGLVVIVALVIVRSLVSILELYASAKLTCGVTRSLKARLFEAFLRAQPREITRRQRGAIVQDINGPAGAISMTVLFASQGLSALIRLLAVSAFLVYLSPGVTLLVVALAAGGLLTCSARPGSVCTPEPVVPQPSMPGTKNPFAVGAS